jgi:hypothetical protein
VALAVAEALVEVSAVAVLAAVVPAAVFENMDNFKNYEYEKVNNYYFGSHCRCCRLGGNRL